MPIKFTIDAGPNTFWKVRVFVWPNQKQLHAAERSHGKQTPTAAAFCWSVSRVEAAKNNEIIAEIHFDRRDMRRRYVYHECYHATVAYTQFIKLNECCESGEEIAAETLEYLIDGILWQLKKLKVKVT